ncbi:MAG: hypothetical protein POELPBGB_01455 [Bacteroidia bacterium]|nr:hypothetical protein [Bacteroidia bacterium]
MYFLSLSVTLLTIIASVHLLAKVRNENLGIFSKLLAYFVLLTAVLILACQLFRGVDKMERGGGKCKKECNEMMMGGNGDHHMMIKKKFRHGGGECTMTEDGRKCKMTEDGKCIVSDEECTCPKGEDGKCKDEGNCKMACCKESAGKEGCQMHKEVEVIIEESNKE